MIYNAHYNCTSFGIGMLSKTAIIFFAVSWAISTRVSIAALPICGNNTTNKYHKFRN